MNLETIRYSLVFVILWQANWGLGQRPQSEKLSATTLKAIDQAITAEMSKQQVIGVAIGVIQKGKIVYTKGYGFADLEKKTPVTTDTVFNWASNSKPLTAIAAMQLVDQNLLDLDEDVRKYVPEFPDNGARITVRHLLCHQSGIPHYSNGKVVPTKRTYKTENPFLDPVTALDLFNQSPLLFEPGTKVSYSSYAYLLLSAVVQNAGKKPFDEQIQTRIAKPLGMRSLQLDVDFNGQSDWSVGYVRTKKDQVKPAPEEAHYWVHGAGGYKSNIQDFTKWALSIVNHKLISQSRLNQMYTRQTTSDGKLTGWGLGFEIDDESVLKVFHSGQHPEATTRLAIYPRSREAVVVLCNCGFATPSRFSTAIFSALNAR